MIVWQAFINLEILLMTAIGLGFEVTARSPSADRDLRRQAWPFLAGLGASPRVLSAALLAYPLYVQFFGPGSYQELSWLDPGLPHRPGRVRARSSRESVAGEPAEATS